MKQAIVSVVSALGLVACGSSELEDLNRQIAEADAKLAEIQAKTSTVNASPGWEYDEIKDEMRGAAIKVASVESDNRLQLPFPYDGGVVGKLNVRRGNGALDAYVTVEKGQFLCRSYDDDVVHIKFDDGPVQSFSCANASDGSSEVVFITNASRFLGKMKTAKKLIVEAEMYNAGAQQLKFTVSNFDATKL